jgi:integrase
MAGSKKPNSKKTQAWSYIAGTKGKNRVRAYEENGQLLMEWFEPLFDNTGNAEIDLATGVPKKARRRLSLTAAGISSYDDAIVKAIETSQRFEQLVAVNRSEHDEEDDEPAGPLSLQKLLELYVDEVTPTLRRDTQERHHTHVRLFVAAFGKDAVVERLVGKHGRPRTALNRKAYNRFLAARKGGEIPGFPTPAKPQTIRNEVRWLRGVFKWATREREDGSLLMVRNPWQGFPLPPADTPMRPEMTPELHDRLVAAAPNWRMAEIMEICRAMGRRVNSVRHLAVTDIDPAAGTVIWQGKFDKTHKTRVTPLREAAKAAIRRALEYRRREGVELSPWLFPACRNPDKPVSCDTLNYWMRETKAKLGIKIRGLGYHGEKRALVRSRAFKELPIEHRVEFIGTTAETLRRVYDFVGLPALLEAVAVLDRAAAPPPPTATARWRRPVTRFKMRNLVN